MSGYYPAGPMLESGIEDYDTQGTTYCPVCRASVTTTLTWRGLQFDYTCPECGADGEGSL